LFYFPKQTIVLVFSSFGGGSSYLVGLNELIRCKFYCKCTSRRFNLKEIYFLVEINYSFDFIDAHEDVRILCRRTGLEIWDIIT
jgi:hypothetical protein